MADVEIRLEEDCPTCRGLGYKWVPGSREGQWAKPPCSVCGGGGRRPSVIGQDILDLVRKYGLIDSADPQRILLTD